MSSEKLTGGCLCGAVRYVCNALPFDADHCHCRMCQRMTGAVVASWMDFKRQQVELTSGKIEEFASSEFARRGFCAKCGSSLSYRDTRYEDYFTLSIASLDNPDLVKVNYHIHTDSKVAWFNIEDDCPRYAKGQGD